MKKCATCARDHKDVGNFCSMVCQKVYLDFLSENPGDFRVIFKKFVNLRKKLNKVQKV